jgi:predicted Zn finger-like uncharacterized protein
MALATQCPHCHTTFRVASDQLKLRGGIVRCGACQSIFDGNAHLIDLDALAASKEQQAAAPAAPPAPPAPAAEAPQAETQAEPPVYTLDFDHTFDPLGILPKAAPDEPSAAPRAQAAEAQAAQEARDATAPAATDAEADVIVAEPALADADPDANAAEPAALPPTSAYAPQGRIEPSFDLPVDEELVAQPLPGDAHADHDEVPAAAGVVNTAAGTDDIPLPMRASAASNDTLAPSSPAPVPKSARAKAVEARSRRTRLTPTKIDAPRLRVPVNADADEPEFVKRSRKQEQSGRTRRLLMIAGAVVLALLLAAQFVAGFRNVLAARYPGARPLLSAGCALLGCRIGLPMQIENLAIETGELSTLGVDTYSLNTLLRNQGSLVQAWPSIQLELTDANDKPLLRRVFGPAEYLPQGVPAAAGFAARAEQPVRLNFALTGLKPSGYHMIIFYQDHP